MGCSGCGIFGMRDFGDVGCWGCVMFGMWDVQNMGCLECRMFGIRDLRDVGLSGFGMWNVGCLPGCEMLIYKIPVFFIICVFFGRFI